MQFAEFFTLHSRACDRYLAEVQRDIAPTARDQALLFPNMVLYTETDRHYLAELFGAVRRYNGLSYKFHRESSANKYVFQFGDEEGDARISLSGRNAGLSYLILARGSSITKAQERFGADVFRYFKTTMHLDDKGTEGALISFLPELESGCVDNCLVVNTHERVYRMKFILNLLVVSKNMSASQFHEDMASIFSFRMPIQNSNELAGVYCCSDTSTAEAAVLSGQFTNLFLVPGLGERNIGTFLHRNRRFTHCALDCVDYLYEKRLKWKEWDNPPEEEYLQPDLLLKSANGYWDICDLKKPFPRRGKITKGKQARRRFIDYVQEGIAQLANYEVYFRFKQNADYAKSEFGVEVNNPKLTLIVGNYENASIDEVKQAALMLKPNYTIVDYDTLNAAFLSRAKAE